MSRRLPMRAALLIWSGVLLAAERPVIEEVIVTAQRVEEDLQKVPIAASAFTDTMIKDRQIVGLEDLQIHTPNLFYSEGSFGRGRYNIRGVGRQNDDGTTEDGVSVHINGIPIPGESRLELFDMARLEVLRGPQGTLYGRSSTGGAINMITQPPDPEAPSGFLEVEYGDYEHRQIEGALNLVLGDQLAVRIAGLGLQRDGFTKNLAAGQVPGVDDDMDGRDLWSARMTAEWWISDRWTVTVLYQRFKEDDDRMLRHALICKQNPLPTYGCLPGEFGFELPHPMRNGFGGNLGPFIGAFGFGQRDTATGLQYDFPRPELDFRHQHTDFNPFHEREEDLATATLEWSGDRFTFTMAGGYFDGDSRYARDETMDVSFTFAANPQIPDGRWPISAPSGGIGSLRTDSQCNVNEGTAGVWGGCVWPADPTRHFRYEWNDVETDQLSLEAKLHSRFDGPVNFLVGANYLTRDNASDFYRFDNITDQIALTGLPRFGVPPRGPGFINLASTHNDFDSYSGFAELYWQASDNFKVTAGVRYNHDKKHVDSTFITPIDTILVTLPAAPPEWLRFQLLGWFLGGQPSSPDDVALTDLYGATDAINAAPLGSVERLRAFQRVPLVPALNELRTLLGISPHHTWTGLTARVGATWSPAPERMLYAFYSRGYKPGGFQRVDTTFGEETVDALEVGAKSRWLDGTLVGNIALFYNDYADMQLDVESTITDNFDAKSWGAELELEWRPSRWPNLQLNLTYSWLHSEFDEQFALDGFDLLQGNTDHVLLDAGLGLPFVAPRADVLPLVEEAIATGQAGFPDSTALYPDGIPVFFSRSFLEANGVATSSGFPANVKDNEVPLAPEHTVGVGLAYSWYLPAGTVHTRWDYYRQSQSFSTVFNGHGSRIPAWHQHNASVAFEAANNRWAVKLWVRNLTDEHNVNNSSFQTGSVGGARFVSVNDPRLFGATLRMNFGLR